MYFTKKMQNHHGGFILRDGVLTGSDNPDVLTCLDYQTSQLRWSDQSRGKCSVLYADGRLYCRDRTAGRSASVAATPAGFELHGRFNQPDPAREAWPHLVIANGMLYVRDEDVMQCYEVRAK